MSKLEELKPNAAVRGILPDGLARVVSVQWFGSEALELTYKTASGKVANELLYRHDEPRLEVVTQGRPWSFDADGRQFRLVSEAHRIRLAHLFDPVLAEHPAPVDGETRRLEVSAAFNAPGPARPLRYQVRLAAFSQEPAEIRQIWNNEPVLFDTVLQHVGRNVHAEADDRSWQTVRAAMEIPPGARSVVISLGASEGDRASAPETYYLDDVQVRFVIAQAPLE